MNIMHNNDRGRISYEPNQIWLITYEPNHNYFVEFGREQPFIDDRKQDVAG